MPAFGQFFQWQFTIDGLPLTDGKLFHYIAGTSDNKNVWAERDRISALAQPLPSDADGIFSGYGDGLYKMVLTESDGLTVINTWDDVNIVANDARGVGAAVASASSLILGDDGDVFHVTGTETIDTIVGNQSLVTLVFDDVLTLTYSASLLLDGGVDFLTASGSVKQFINEGSGGVWREVASPLDTIVGDIKIKKDTPLVRFKGTGGSGEEYAVGENLGNWAVWLNAGTEAVPVWSGRIAYAKATTLWTLTGDVTITGDIISNFNSPTIISFANATHDHGSAASGGAILGHSGQSSTGVANQTIACNSGVSFATQYTSSIAVTHVATVASTVMIVMSMQALAVSYDNGVSGNPATFGLARDGTTLTEEFTSTTFTGPHTITVIDTVAAGSYTYRFYAKLAGSTGDYATAAITGGRIVSFSYN